MLLTFPTKESLLRNLNDMPVQEKFLIIANYKTFKNWNLIPLKSLTMVLGPNSAGKSIIYEVVEILRDLRIGYPQYPLPFMENTAFGISCPYYVDDVLNSEICQLSFDGIEITGKGDAISEDADLFLIDELLKEKGIFSDKLINKKRYTLVSNVSWIDMWETMIHQVYINNTLMSTLQQDFEDSQSYATPDQIKVKYSFTKESNNEFYLLAYLDSLAAALSVDGRPLTRFEEKIIQSANNRSADQLVDDIIFQEYWVEYFPENLYETFEKYPKDIVREFSSTNYFDSYVGFSMAMALYHYPINTFLKVWVRGCASQDTRELCSDWRDTEFSKSGYEPINYDTYNMINVSLDSINNWLSAKWLFDSPYVIEKEETIVFPKDVVDSEFKLDIEQMDIHLRKAYSFKGSRRFFLKDKKEDIALNFDQVGSGFTQIIPLLAGLSSRLMLVFKQPELHLHPKLQSRIADCFVETVFNERNESESRIRIIETHSEHFVLRLLRRIRDSKGDSLFHSIYTLYKDDVAFVYIQPNEGRSLVYYLPVTDDGEFVDNWPDGFFDERDEDIWGTPPTKGV